MSRNLATSSNRIDTKKTFAFALACLSAAVLSISGCAAERDERTPGDQGERPEGTDVPVTPLEPAPEGDENELISPGGDG